MEQSSVSAIPETLIVRQLGRVPYEATWQAMQRFTEHRTPETADEIWLLEHPPVFTQGQAGKAEHVLAPGDIPVVQVDRGGQVTYHGPGQLVVYLLIDVFRRGLGSRAFVSLIEDALVAALGHWGIDASPRQDAPGVYIGDGRKIASLGLRIRKKGAYHGLALNVAMDLEPFARINPCGLVGMAMTQMSEFVPDITVEQVGEQLLQALVERLPSDNLQLTQEPPTGFNESVLSRN
ncbi:lipoyl(octanoyl) transferase LipB [Marinobacteraceae bacterium S3BR75-40.1]